MHIIWRPFRKTPIFSCTCKRLHCRRYYSNCSTLMTRLHLYTCAPVRVGDFEIHIWLILLFMRLAAAVQRTLLCELFLLLHIFSSNSWSQIKLYISANKDDLCVSGTQELCEPRTSSWGKIATPNLDDLYTARQKIFFTIVSCSTHGNLGHPVLTFPLNNSRLPHCFQ